MACRIDLYCHQVVSVLVKRRRYFIKYPRLISPSGCVWCWSAYTNHLLWADMPIGLLWKDVRGKRFVSPDRFWNSSQIACSFFRIAYMTRKLTLYYPCTELSRTQSLPLVLCSLCGRVLYLLRSQDSSHPMTTWWEHENMWLCLDIPDSQDLSALCL